MYMCIYVQCKLQYTNLSYINNSYNMAPRKELETH